MSCQKDSRSLLTSYIRKKLLIKMFHISLRCEGSNPELGSSKIITFGFPIKEIAKESLLRIPPDN